jgi:hypothetical protein
MNTQFSQDFIRDISPHLTAEDDADFWISTVDVLLSEARMLILEKPMKQEIFLQVGACSHWRRPNQDRWTAQGGFAWPDGYVQKYRDHRKNSWGPIGGGNPELDWFVLVRWNRDNSIWEMTDPKFHGKRKFILRAALPTRTGRHQQAAIHTVWVNGTPEDPDNKVVRFYGFRKRGRKWECVTSQLVRQSQPGTRRKVLPE